MRITYLLTTADNMGGTERAVFAQAAAFADDHDVVVLSVFRSRARPFFATPGVRVEYLIDVTGSAPQPVDDAHGYNDSELQAFLDAPSAIVRASWEPAFSALSDILIEGALRSIETDVLVATTPPTLALAAELAPGRVIVVDEEHRASAMRGPDQEPLLIYGPRVDAVVSLTDRSTSWFADTYGVTAPRLVTIPNSIPHMFRPRANPANKTVVAAGRFSGQKQFDHLIEAFRFVVDERPDWTLRLYGDGPAAGSLRKLASSLGLSAHVLFPGSVEDMAEEWSKGSIFAATSRSEGLPLVALEACAAGVPVVSYDCPTGPAEIIDGGRNGVLVPLGDKRAMADALLSLINDDQRRRRLGEAALESASRYSPETVRAQWLELFEQLIRDRDDDGPGSTRVTRAARRIADRRSATKVGSAPLQASGATSRVERTESVARPALTLRLAGLENAEAVITALTEHAVPHFVIPSTQSKVTIVGVEGRRRDAVYDALRASNATADLEAAVISGANNVQSTRPVRDLADLELSRDQALRVFRRLTDPTGALVIGPGVGCDIEFWASDPSDPSQVTAPRHNPLVDALQIDMIATLPTTEIGSMQVRSVAGLAGRRWDEIDFPIDVVYAWVDGDDPEWQARKASALRAESAGLHQEATSAQRFTNRDELKYSLRSLDQYAPWIRNVYVVTDKQVPPWLATDHPGLRVVDHTELFADPSTLPTFNSHAIETQLRRIDGLSEHFLYFNDDVFIGRHVEPSLFFYASGVSKFFPSPVKLNFGGNPPPHISAGRVNRALLRRDFDRSITQSVLHTPHPLRRSVLAALEEQYEEEFRATSARRFRNEDDVAVPSSLYPYYAFMTGLAVPGAVRYTYLNLDAADIPHRMSGLLQRRTFDVICMGESGTSTWSAEQQLEMARSFLTEYYPVPSRFERPYPST